MLLLKLIWEKNEISQTKGGPVIIDNNISGKQNILDKDKTCQGKGKKVNKQKKVDKYSFPWTMLVAYTNEGRWEPGQILTAVRVDANNEIYPVAYAIVEAESKASWCWFLNLLGEDLGIEVNFNYTFISDRQKAIASVFPSDEHMYCVRHIHENIKSQFKGGVYKEMLWNAAKATSVGEFNKKMAELKSFNSDAYDWLMKIPAEQWSKGHFSVVQKVIAKTVGLLTPSVTKLFDAIKEKATEYIVQWNRGFLYQVTGPYKDQYVVNMETRLYSCRKWELTGIPCKHVVAAIYNMSENSAGVNPCNGKEMWLVVESRTVIIPPLYKPQVGKPPKKRKKSHDEIANESCSSGKLSRKGKSVRCGKCGNVGHNRKGCRGQGGATQAGGSSARNISGQAGARRANGARNVSGQAADARNVSSQSGGSSQPIAAQSTATVARNTSSQAAGAS
ncbi:mutator type transposase [Tanacetum coccineum]|uniref:Mutator type transposase n=1 Tax=Tanacetum coccineum TaxID=301880 RepID=A0ABQ4Z1J3_9ASTR